MATARVVVFGYGRLALVALDTFERLGVAPAAVVVPGNRQGPEVDMVATRAREKSWPVLVQPRRKDQAPFLDAIAAVRPEVLFVWSYPMLLSPELIALAPKGAVNIHGAALPEYRGGHVMNWTILNGERESAATLHYLDAGIDTGPVVAEERFPIGDHDDIATVQSKLKAAGEALLEKWWPAIAQGTAPRVRQDESRARYYRMRSADDGLVEWERKNVEIRNLVRALVAPWPGAHTWCETTKLVLRSVAAVDAAGGTAPPGTVVRFEPGDIRIATGSGDLQLLVVEVDGRAADWELLTNAGLGLGTRLASVPAAVPPSQYRDRF